jgi:hypothetical protein
MCSRARRHAAGSAAKDRARRRKRKDAKQERLRRHSDLEPLFEPVTSWAREAETLLKGKGWRGKVSEEVVS